MHNLQEPPPIERSERMQSPHLLIVSILIINVSLSFLLHTGKLL